MRAAEPAKVPPLVGARVLWLGDSITQAGGYVTDVEYFLNRAFPDRPVDIISVGLSSETVSGLSEKRHPFPRPCLHERLRRALDAVKPSVVVACYGMNDGIYHPEGPGRTKAFQDGIMQLIAAAKAVGASVVLLTPPPFDAVPVKSVRPAGEPDYSYMAPFAGYDSVLAEYSAWERTLQGPGVTVVDLHSALADYLKAQRAGNPAYAFGRDGIHPNAAGHLLMARTILKAFGVNAGEGDLDAGLKALAADPVFHLVERHRSGRSNGWLAFVGYTRGNKVKKESVEAEEKAAEALQREIDSARRGK